MIKTKICLHLRSVENNGKKFIVAIEVSAYHW